MKEKDNITEMVDPKLGSDFNKEQVRGAINVALLCTCASPARRPAMSSVVSMLEGRSAVEEVDLEAIVATDDVKISRKKQRALEKSSSSSSRFQVISSSLMMPTSRASDQEPLKLDPDTI